MKTFSNTAAQGDLLICRIKELPAGLTLIKPEGDKHIVAHSETGHHHTFPTRTVELLARGDDPMVMYFRVTGESADLVHHRPHDTHETIGFSKGDIGIMRRQREYTPEGWRRVED